MALKMGLLGGPNTGKTFSQAFLTRPEEVFVLSPTDKVKHLGAKGDYKIKFFNVSYDGKSFDDTAKHYGLANDLALIRKMMMEDMRDDKLAVTGDYFMVSKIKSLAAWKTFIPKYMPQKRIIWTNDFSHYISGIAASDEFRARTSKDQAFARFWDLAADALNNVFTAPMPSNMIDLTEFHIDYSEVEQKYIIFVPMGKMLTEKFKPESYFDVALFSRVVPWEDQRDQMERYKFVVIPKGWYDGRNMGLLDDIADSEGEINNYRLQEVLDKVLAYLDRQSGNSN
jgi:hypothetical protein